MERSTVERRLAAILAMDVVGYSRLMGANEVGTLNALKTHRAELIDPVVATHHGRLVKTTGDGLLLEFASVVDAIGCAVALQRGMLTRNAAVPEQRRIVFRIGVNIGDIIIDGDDIFGDGVNVAARLEALCEPGGICISRAANEQVQDKLALSFADLGEHTVKNIARAVGVFGLAAKDIASLPEVAIDRPHIPELPRRTHRTAYVAGAVGAAVLACLAGIAIWWKAPAGPAPGLQQQVLAVLAKNLPTTSEKYREEVAGGFTKLPPRRALAVARKAGGSWRTGNWPTRELAEEKALEKCQQYFDEPCALIAADDAIVAAAGDGSWPVRDTPRVRYAGLFNPERIPSVRQKELDRADVAAYATAPEPKAMAFHANAGLHVVGGVPSQRAAEEQALRACNNDPHRKETGGPCYLYAAGNRVVLPLRSTVPMAAAPAATAAPAVPAEAPLRGALLAALAKAAPSLPAATRESQVNGYLSSNGQKAIAAAPPGNSWRTFGLSNATIAEERVLEGCQARYGDPCMLIALNETLLPAAADGQWPRRPMPRTAYDGLFDPQQIPNAADTVRQRPDVAGYRAQPGPKAAAYHPWGRLFVVTGAAAQRAAEEQALHNCNADPQRNGQAGTCLLYAVENQVVLPKRSAAPLTPAK